jgi:hypothetical protein
VEPPRRELRRGITETKIMNWLLSTYLYKDAKEMLLSMFPSFKYDLLLEMSMVSSVASTLEVLLGFKLIVFIAFIISAITEFITGVYASVFIRKEKFESAKIGRFVIKLFILIVILFITNAYGKGMPEGNSLFTDGMRWLYGFIFALGALEYITSILENYAVIKGYTKSYYIDKITGAFNKFFHL